MVKKSINDSSATPSSAAHAVTTTTSSVLFSLLSSLSWKTILEIPEKLSQHDLKTPCRE